jgi:hypothetical protein
MEKVGRLFYIFDDYKLRSIKNLFNQSPSSGIIFSINVPDEGD